MSEPAQQAASSAPNPTSSAVAIRAEQSEFDERQVAALRLINKSMEQAPREVLAVFFHHCVRTRLDPFARQIYLIGRRTKRGMQYTIQTGIDGARLIAHRAVARDNGALTYEDTVYYDRDGNKYEAWLQNGPPAAVKVVVVRNDANGRSTRFPMTANWSEFAPYEWDAEKAEYVLAWMWRRMPAHMLRKCAEMGSLRMAAPQDLADIYIDEEMAAADAEQVAGTAQDAAARLRRAAGIETPSEQENDPGSPDSSQ